MLFRNMIFIALTHCLFDYIWEDSFRYYVLDVTKKLIYCKEMFTSWFFCLYFLILMFCLFIYYVLVLVGCLIMFAYFPVYVLSLMLFVFLPSDLLNKRVFHSVSQQGLTVSVSFVVIIMFLSSVRLVLNCLFSNGYGLRLNGFD